MDDEPEIDEIDTVVTENDIETNNSDLLEVSEFADKKTLGFGFWLAAFWLVLISFLAVFSPILPFKDADKNYIAYEQKENPITGKMQERPIQPPYAPSSEHWLGTDQDARDMLSRSIEGARISLAVGALTALFGMIVGGTLGMIAGYFKGILDKVVGAIFLVVLSFPGLILAILIVALLDRSLMTISITLGILGVAPIGRLARAQTLSFSEREFVLAAEVMGVSTPIIIVRHIIPHVASHIVVALTIAIPSMILAESTLSFLGLGIRPPMVSWGRLLRDAQSLQTLNQHPWMMIPGGFIVLAVMAFNFLGDGLRDAIDPYSK